MRRVKLIALALLLASAWCYASESDLILRAGGLTAAEPPVVIGDSILLSYAFPGGVRDGGIHAVQAAFSHEGFGTLHVFSRNRNGVYVLSIPRTYGLTEFTYRLVVDGIWTTDPVNPDVVSDAFGVAMSRFTIAAVQTPSGDSPVLLDNGLVEFSLLGKTGQHVTIVGSFNGWDPFMTSMVEHDGVFRRTLRLPPGEHLYYFLVDGLRVPDPGNSRQKLHRDGQIVSILDVP